MGVRSGFLMQIISIFIFIFLVSSARIEISPRANGRLKARQDTPESGTVNLESFPDIPCASYCTSYNYISQCTPRTVPCSTSKTGCYEYDRGCYCSQPISLYCAWGCPWLEYFEVEDWYKKVCPETPNVDFEPLPVCAKQCIMDSINDDGCVNHSRNCICLRNNLYGCPAACNDPDKEQIRNWWGSTCSLTPEEVDDSNIVTAAATETASFQGSIPQGAEQVDRSGDITGPGQYKEATRKLKWYEIYGLIIVLVTIVLVSTVYFFVWRAKLNYIKAMRATRAANAGKQAEKRSSMEKTAISSKSTEKIATPRRSIEKQ